MTTDEARNIGKEFDRLNAIIREQADEIDRLTARQQAALSLHSTVVAASVTRCSGCNWPVPCPTVAALTEQEDRDE